ncbi:hypothetical protein [Kitasatospora sp. GP30]|uniref:hypothetical protein n=1 Tax=Kitasatospora sp. GP30 TaxID=3035084 RepID=UPI002476C447|nr:hypothetical protein [Kitasatospora sp. GP30]
MADVDAWYAWDRLTMWLTASSCALLRASWAWPAWSRVTQLGSAVAFAWSACSLMNWEFCALYRFMVLVSVTGTGGMAFAVPRAVPAAES